MEPKGVIAVKEAEATTRHADIVGKYLMGWGCLGAQANQCGIKVTKIK